MWDVVSLSPACSLRSLSDKLEVVIHEKDKIAKVDCHNHRAAFASQPVGLPARPGSTYTGSHCDDTHTQAGGDHPAA
jgi:hypothetical protein